MKKILLSLSIVAVIGIVVVGATSSYFSDTENSTDNTFAAGTMDLDINGADVATTTIVLANLAPSDSGKDTDTVLKNSGSLDGELDVTMGAVINYPCTDSTYGANDETEYCLADAGVLGANAQMALYIDVDETGTWTTNDIRLNSDQSTSTSGVLIYDTIDTYSGKTWNSAVATMQTDDEYKFVIDWKIPTTADNTIQGDALKFNITFTLEQADAD